MVHTPFCGCVSRRGFLGGVGALGAATLGAAGLVVPAGAQARPNRIDVHHHFNPPEFVAALAKHATVPAIVKNWTIEHSLEQMDRAGIQTAMLSVTAPGVWWGDKAEAAALARSTNEWGAAQVRDHKGRFGLYAVIFPEDIDGSLKEIAYAMDTLHADGIAMFTNYGNKWLGDPAFAPIYEELNRRGAVVYTHPTDAPCCIGPVPAVYDPMIEWGTHTTRAIATMVFNKFNERYPDMKVIFSHAGGTMPGLIERFEYQATLSKFAGGVHPALSHFMYDTAQAANPQALGSLLTIVPASQVLLGTDYPYRTCDGQVDNLLGLNLKPEVLAAIERGNAMRIMPRLA